MAKSSIRIYSDSVLNSASSFSPVYSWFLTSKQKTSRTNLREAEAIFNEIGMNMTTAINIFLKQSIRENGIPFELKINQPNIQTIEAIKEGEASFIYAGNGCMENSFLTDNMDREE